MGDVGLMGRRAKHRLAEAELDVLRDEARSVTLHAARDMERSYDPDRNGGRSEAEIQEEERDQLLGAASVYGMLDNAALAFGDHRGASSPPVETVDVVFPANGLEWMRALHEELRPSLEERRGSIEMDGSGVAQETFLLFVLDGIFGERV
jgi:hypothetical protein